MNFICFFEKKLLSKLSMAILVFFLGVFFVVVELFALHEAGYGQQDRTFKYRYVQIDNERDIRKMKNVVNCFIDNNNKISHCIIKTQR